MVPKAAPWVRPIAIAFAATATIIRPVESVLSLPGGLPSEHQRPERTVMGHNRAGVRRKKRLKRAKKVAITQAIKQLEAAEGSLSENENKK